MQKSTSAGSGSIVAPGVNRQIHGASRSDEAIAFHFEGILIGDTYLISELLVQVISFDRLVYQAKTALQVNVDVQSLLVLPTKDH